jgi:putative membrane protein
MRDNPQVTPIARTAIGLGALLGGLLLPGAAFGHGADAPWPVFPWYLLAWRFEPIVAGGVAVAALAYLAAVGRVNARHPLNRLPIWRSAAFLAGLMVIVLALVSPIEAYEGSLFWVHMLQHMLLQLVAAPLLLLGAPVTLALRVARPRVRRGILAILQSRPVHVISHPIAAWLLFAIVNWGWHFSPLYDQALENRALHDLQHATFLAAALLFWWPVVAADPGRRRLPHPVRLLYVFLAMPQNSFLGVALMSAVAPLYPHYVSNLRAWGPTPLADQQLGGVLMWVGGDLAFLVAMVVVVAAWMRYEDRRTARLDARLDADAAATTEATRRVAQGE